MFPTDSTKKASRPSASAASSKHHSFHNVFHRLLHKHKTNLSTVASIVQHSQEIITASPFSFLAPILVILNQLLSAIKNAFENHDDGRVLASQVSECINMVEKYYNCTDDHSLRTLQDEDITKYIDSLKQAQEEAAKVAGRKPIPALLHAFENKAKLEKTSKDVDKSTIDFILKRVLAIGKKLDEMHAHTFKDETRSSSEPNPSTPPMIQHSRPSGVAGQSHIRTPDQNRPPLSMPVPQVDNRMHGGIRMPEPELHHPSPEHYKDIRMPEPELHHPSSEHYEDIRMPEPEFHHPSSRRRL